LRLRFSALRQTWGDRWFVERSLMLDVITC
jgi:hypothetical protein